MREKYEQSNFYEQKHIHTNIEIDKKRRNKKKAFLKALAQNSFQLDKVEQLTGVSLAQFIAWIQKDANFLQELSSLLSAYRYIIEIEMMASLKKGGWKIKDCESVLNLLPTTPYSQEKQESFYAIIPKLLEDNENEYKQQKLDL